MSRVVKLTETETRRMAAGGWERGDGELVLMGLETQFGKIKKFWRWMEVTVTQHYGYIDTQWH